MNEYLEQHKTVITLNAETLEAYDQHHAKFHPKRKKPSLDWAGKKRTGQLVSWNRFVNCPNRIMQNQWKQEFADYTQYLLRKQGLSNKNIERCAIVVKQYNSTRAKSDSDNIMVKASLDAMVKEGFITEDNYTVVNPVILTTDYDKDNPRSEICVYEITDEYTEEFVFEVIRHELYKKIK